MKCLHTTSFTFQISAILVCPNIYHLPQAAMALWESEIGISGLGAFLSLFLGAFLSLFLGAFCCWFRPPFGPSGGGCFGVFTAILLRILGLD